MTFVILLEMPIFLQEKDEMPEAVVMRVVPEIPWRSHLTYISCLSDSLTVLYFFLFHICSSSYICTTFYYKSSFHATKLHTITFLAWNLRWHGWLMHTCHGIDTKFMMQLEMNNMAWIYFGTRNGISILFYFLPQRLTKRRRQQQSFFMLLLLCHKMLLLNYLSLYFYK